MKVKVKAGINYGVLLFTSKKYQGECNKYPDGRREILLNENLNDKQFKLTLIHEVLHALSFEYDIKLTETQVRKLEVALAYLVKNNKGILK